MSMKSRLLRYWTYFRRGHGVYLIFAISFLNFIVIQYQLLIREIPFLQALFSSLIIFTLVFFVVYVPLAVVIGWIDYKRGSVPVDSIIAYKASPYHRDLARAIMLLAEGKNKEVMTLMEIWTKK